MQTIIQQAQAAITFNQSRVCDLLQWHPDTLALFIYERGMQFLYNYYSNDEQAIKKMSAQAAFWNWWKNEWNQRDESYLHTVDGREDELSAATLIKLYRSLHLVTILVCEIAPPRVVYPADFFTIKIEMA